MKPSLGICILLATAFGLRAVTFTVTSTNNSGAGSLRQAILDANATVGVDTIEFGITNAARSILPTNALPAITDPVTIDGTTQPGFLNSPIVELNGQSAGSASGLILATNNCVVRGLVINRFSLEGIVILGASNAVEGCIIGLDVAGTTDRGNTRNGILITNAPNNRIGGTNLVQRNLISGNNQSGVLIVGAPASNNVVIGNWLGCDVTGQIARGNSLRGVWIDSASDNVVGGTGPGAGNLISGNSNEGVHILGLGATNNFVLGNLIGTDATGTKPLGNGSHGVWFNTNPRLNVIGSTNVGAPNVIAFNGGDGVFVQAGTNNVLRGNAIYSNTGLGIDLGVNGLTGNDNGDPDTGANQLQNFPVLTNAAITPLATTIQGRLNSRSNTSYTLDFYANQLPDSTGIGEGQFWIGATNVTTDATSNATFAVAFPLAAQGRFISATATDPSGNTSEFATNTTATSTITPGVFMVTNTNDSGAGSLRQAMLDSNTRINNGTNTIQFNIAGAGVQTIALLSPLPAISEPVLIDGYSQPGSTTNSHATAFNGNPLIRLDGASAGAGADGLQLANGSSTVRGLVIVHFAGDGISIATGGNTVSGNLIGVDLDGTDQGNTLNGVSVNGAAANLIGGILPWSRNLISGNNSQGVILNGAGAAGNVIQGNLIGTDLTGSLDRGNSGDGVQINGPSNLVGGTTPGAKNIISGNNGRGVQITGATATNNTVLGNFIGTDVTSGLALGNTSSGIYLASNTRGNRLGGTNASEANVIAYNGGDGVFVQTTGTGNAIRGNSIHGSGELGIDLGANGVLPNDSGDADTGANQLQNYPVLTNGIINSSSTVIQGFLNSVPGASFQLDFFANVSIDSSGYGEGQVYLGSLPVMTTADSNTTFSVTLPVRAAGRYLSATATDAQGNTSEFSPSLYATSTVAPTIFTVVNTNNSGAGSLREAIFLAHTVISSTNNLIAFNIAGSGVQTIRPLTELPTIAEPITIDGYTQTNASPNVLSNGNNAAIRIRLDGTNVAAGISGLVLFGTNIIVRGLNIIGFSDHGIEIVGGASNRVAGNFIGVGLDGSDQGNDDYGVLITDSPGNVIGGLVPADRNVISGNGNDGIFLSGAGSSGNIVQGNFLGTDPTGTLDVGNSADGVIINNGASNLIGGTTPGARNVISGNTGQGIEIYAANATNNFVQGNFIGIDVTGTQPLANGSHGVYITTSARINLIGGPTPGAGNLIAFNGGDGVYLNSGTNNNVRANSIHSNGGLGIDLDPNNVTTNDLNDVDTGINNRQNFPILASVTINPGNTMITGSLNSVASRTYALDFFASDTADPSGYGEGRYYLGSISATTDPSGNTNFNVVLPVSATGKYVAATATDPDGNTSEFSPWVFAVTTVPGLNFVVTNTNDSGPGSFREAILSANATFNVGDTISFNIAGSGSHTITTVSALPPLTDIVTINGYSQPGAVTNSLAAGFNAALKIALNGTNAGSSVDGLRFEWPGITVRGLGIVNFRGDGIEMTSVASNCVVEGCVIGLGLNGSGQGNQPHGIFINGSVNNRIGSGVPSARNVIADNTSSGVEISGGGTNVVEGNIIGLTPQGAAGVGNFYAGVNIINSPSNRVGPGNVISGNNTYGVRIQDVASVGNQIIGNVIGLDLNGAVTRGNQIGVDIAGARNTVIGGTVPGLRNIVSGNSGNGIYIHAWTSAGQGTVLQGNYVGTDISGQYSVPNGNHGVLLTVPNHVIGGTAAGAGNLISGNTVTGIEIFGAGTTNVAVQGNLIGVNAMGTLPVPNGGNGIQITGNAKQNQVGGTNSGAPNVIAFNEGVGVFVLTSTNNTVLGNSIFQNGGLGLDIGASGPALNDAGDGDVGVNDGQNYPVLKYGIVGAGATTLVGSLNSQSNRSYRIEFFANPDCDDFGYGEGRTFLGSANVTTDGTGNVNFNVVSPVPLATGDVVTATATDPFGNTSEFSACAPVVPVGSVDLRVALTDSPDPARLGFPVTYVITVTNDGPSAATNVRVTNTLPAGAIFSSATNSQGTFTQSGGIVTFNLGTLNDGASATMAVFAALNAAGVNSNNVVGAANEFDHSSANNAAQVTTVAGMFDLQVGLIGTPDSIDAGQTITMIATVTNLGPDVASNVTVRISPGLSAPGFANVNALGPGTFSYQDIGGSRTVVTWTPGAVAAGAGVQAAIQAIPIRLGVNSSSANVFSLAGVDTVFVNNYREILTTVNPGAGIFMLDPKHFVREPAGPLLVNVRREGGSNGTVSVSYTTSPETAVPPDYTHVSGTLTFTNGQTNAVISIPISNDTAPECNETFRLTLSNPTGGGVLISQSNSVIEIADNDFATPPAVTALAGLSSPRRITASYENADFGSIESSLWDLTPDGRYIAFVGAPPNLAPPKSTDNYDVLVFDRQTGHTRLVSISYDGTSGGDDYSSNPGISDDGRYVVFESYAANLTVNDPGSNQDVFLRDLQTGITTLVSVNSAGAGPGNDSSEGPVLSANNRFVAFASYAGNLTSGDTNHASDVFVRILTNNTTTLVSINTNGLAGNASSFAPRISSNGLFVAFESSATDLVPGDTNNFTKVFVRNLQTGVTMLASLDVNGQSGEGFVADLSADGRFVVFESDSVLTTNDSNNARDVLVRDLQFGTTTLLSVNSAGTGAANGESRFYSMSRDARFIGFESQANNLVSPATWPTLWNVYRRDRVTGTTTLVSVSTNGAADGNNHSFSPVVSEDGRYVAFQSAADNLAGGFEPGATFFPYDNIYLRDLQTATTTLVSHQPSSSRGADGWTQYPLISANGQVVAFDSSADNLVAGDGNDGDTDVYVWTLSSNAPMLVSGALSSTPSRQSYEPWVSRDGRYVTFTTRSDELVANDLNGGEDVFMRDVVTGTLTLISGNSAGTGTANGSSSFPVMSQDARYVAFYSSATNITVGDTNDTGDIYLRDRLTGAAELISVNSDGWAAGNANILDVSADGRFVAFDTRAGGIVPGVPAGRMNVYLRDRLLDKTTLVSAWHGGNTGGNGDSFRPLLSPSGWHVMFESQASDLVPDDPNGSGNDVFLRDMTGNTTVKLTGTNGSSFDNATFSLDGRFLAFDAYSPTAVPGDTNLTWDVFVRDLFTGQTILVSRNLAGTGTGNGRSQNPVISVNGRYVAFHSAASDLVAGDTNNAVDVFVRDLLTGVTRLASLNCHGTAPGNGESEAAEMSADGRFIAFDSIATDLVPGDLSAGASGAYNVFLRDMALNQTRLISVRTNGEGGGNIGLGAYYGSYFAFMSANANTIAFFSDADNLVTNDNNLNQDLFYVRPTVTSATAELSVSIIAVPASPTLGSNVTLTITVTNYGPNTATNVVITDLLPAGLTYVSATVSQGSFGRTNNAIVASLGNVANGAKASLTIQATATVLGPHLNTANAFSDVTDTGSADNYATVVITVLDPGVGPPPPSLEVRRAGSTTQITWPSSAVGYQLQTTTNLGPAIQWQVITNGIVDDGTWKSYAVTNRSDRSRFFRLSQQ